MAGIPITLTQGSNYPISISFIDGDPVLISSSVSGASPVLNLAAPHTFTTTAPNNKVQVLHSASETVGLSGCLTVSATTASSVTVTGATLAANGGSNGYVAKAARVNNYFLVGVVFLDCPLNLQVAGVTGSIDGGGDQLLIRGAQWDEIKVGDLITIDSVGLKSARVKVIQSLRSATNELYHVAILDKTARTATTGSQIQVLRRVVTSFVVPPQGDGTCGTFYAEFRHTDFTEIFAREACASGLGSEPRRIGYYQIMLGHGVLTSAANVAAGYKPFYHDLLQEVKKGDFYVIPSAGGVFADW